MSCKPVCRLCDNLVLSQAVTFTGGNLEINLPAGAYNNGGKYCIVVAQSIPATTTINAPVYITIGTGTELYPLTKRNCSGDCLRHPHSHPLLRLCGDYPHRRLVPHVGAALLLSQQQSCQY